MSIRTEERGGGKEEQEQEQEQEQEREKARNKEKDEKGEMSSQIHPIRVLIE
jgi:hypothetical protein